MTHIRKWALAVCWALLLTACSATSNAQDVTGNLIYTTINPPPPGSVYSWGGFVNTESGGGGGDGGHVPAYNGALGQFMFGWMPGTVNYSMAVSSALSGTGLRVTGIQYGLEYFNQDYSRGSLSATWALRDSSGKVLESYYHAFGPTTEGWTKFDQNKTFTNPYSLASVGNLDFSITGSDDRFWAGYYGPQVRNPYARLTYGADLCATDPMSSPSCPGYLDTINKLLPAQPTTATVVTETPATVTTTTTTTTTPVATESPLPAGSTTSTTAPSASSTSATASVAPTATNPQPRVGEVAVSGSQSKNLPSTAQILSIVRAEQSRVAAVEATAVQTAVTQAQVTAQQAQEQGLTVSAATVSQSQAASQTAMASASNTPSSIYSVTPSAISSGVSVISTGSSVTASQSPLTTRSLEDTNQSQGIKFSGSDPVSSVMTAQPPTAAAPESTPGPGVNTKAQDNDAAGGVTLAAMARTPQGFEAYMGMLPDTRFYAPREIYRGQRVVDNARLQRALSGASDRLHQEIVDQQYKK